MFEVKINGAYGMVWRFMEWSEMDAFVCMVLGNGSYERSDGRVERLSVTITEVGNGEDE